MEISELRTKSSNVSVGRIVMNTIRKYVGSNGISLPQLKKILRETKKLDVALHNSEIKLALKNALDRGILSREGGSYQVVNVNARAKNSSKDVKTTRGTQIVQIRILKGNSSRVKVHANVRVQNSSKDAKTIRPTKKEHINILKDKSSTLKMNASVRMKKPSKDAKTTRTKKEPIKIPKFNNLSLIAGPDSGSGLEVGDILVRAVTEDSIVRTAEEDANVREAEEDTTTRAVEEDVNLREAEEDVTMGTEEEDANSPFLRDNDDQEDDVQKQNSEEQE